MKDFMHIHFLLIPKDYVWRRPCGSSQRCGGESTAPHNIPSRAWKCHPLILKMSSVVGVLSMEFT
eukprot:4494177-Amphidinium_carterae.1